MKKSLIVYVSVFILSVALVACQSNPTTTTEDPPKKTTNPPVEEKQTDNQNEQVVQSNLVKEIFEKATKGEMYGAEMFPIGTSVETVLQEWGTPESGDPAFLAYPESKKYNLIAEDTQKLNGIVAYTTEIIKIQVSDVKNELGESNISVKKNDDKNLQSLNYQAGDYKLYFYYTGDTVSQVILEK